MLKDNLHNNLAKNSKELELLLLQAIMQEIDMMIEDIQKNL